MWVLLTVKLRLTTAPHRRRAGPTAGTLRPHEPARLPPRRHPCPPLAHGVAGWHPETDS